MYKSFFEINREILKSFDKEEVIRDKYYEIEETKDGYRTFRYNNNGKKIYVNSKYDVNNEINMLFNNVDFDKDSLFIVYGMGLGYHVKELIKRSSPKSKIFVIESNMEILNTYLRNENLLDICSDKVFLFFGNEQKIIAEINSHIFSFSIMPLSVNCVPVIMLSYFSIYGEWIKNINKRIMDLFRHALFNLGNDIEDTIIGLRNNFKNIKELVQSPSIEVVKDKYKGMPAIIVSAGPSLDKNINELKNAQGKALILANDAVISTLAKHNIVPDAIFSIERVMETYDAFYKNNDIDKDTIFVGPPVVVKEIFGKLRNNKMMLCLKQGEKINEWINNSILQENRLIQMGTSCAHIAFGFAKYVNADPIIFVGQDLAYTKDGITHSENVEIKQKVDEISEEVIYVKGINGELLPTSYAYKNFLTFLEAEMAKDTTERTYIDATEGGAFKHGTKIMRLKEVILEYCKESVMKLNDLVPKSSELDINKYNRAINELDKLAQKFNNLKVDCEKLLKVYNRLEKDINNQNVAIKEVFKKLRKKEEIDNIIFKEDVIRTFLQGVLMISNMKENSLGNKENFSVAGEKVKIYKSLMNSLIIGCNVTYKSINDIIHDMVKVN